MAGRWHLYDDHHFVSLSVLLCMGRPKATGVSKGGVATQQVTRLNTNLTGIANDEYAVDVADTDVDIAKLLIYFLMFPL